MLLCSVGHASTGGEPACAGQITAMCWEAKPSQLRIVSHDDWARSPRAALQCSCKREAGEAARRITALSPFSGSLKFPPRLSPCRACVASFVGLYWPRRQSPEHVQPGCIRGPPLSNNPEPPTHDGFHESQSTRFQTFEEILGTSAMASRRCTRPPAPSERETGPPLHQPLQGATRARRIR